MTFKQLFVIIIVISGVLRSALPAVADPPIWVDASTFGYNSIDATSALQAAINTGASTVYVPNMGTPWAIQPISLNSSNQEIIFEDGVLVEAMAGCFTGSNDSLFRAADKSNITLSGYGARFRMRKEDYVPLGGEWRMGVWLRSCSNVTIQGMRIENTGGDGIYLGSSSAGTPNRDVIIRNVTCEDNYRQGISVVNAENLLIEDCVLRTTNGTNPQAGIDFEPNHSNEKLINCIVRNTIIEGNNHSGMDFYLNNLNDSSSETSGIIENCTVINNGDHGIWTEEYLPNWTFKDCLIVGNNGYGMRQDFDWFNETDISYSAFWGNSSGTTSNINKGTGVLTNVQPIFASTDINDPQYMYLAENTPAAILNGASDGGYMGARPIVSELPVKPVALDDPVLGYESYYTVNEDTPLYVDALHGVLVNDLDPNGDPLTAVKVSDPAHGMVTLNLDGSLNYMPDLDWNGTDSFTYIANDGTNNSNVATVSLVVNPIADVTLTLVDNGSPETGLHSYTLTATGPGITTLSKFTIDGEVHQVFDTGSTSEWLGDGSASESEASDSHVIFGDLRFPDLGGETWPDTSNPPDHVTRETKTGDGNSGMGTLSNYDDSSIPIWDAYVKAGVPSAEDETVELIQLVVLDGHGFTIDLTLVTSTNYDCITGESTIYAHDLSLTLPTLINGDANGDGYIDSTDASIMAQHWLQDASATWADGDFNGDGKVNDIDATILAANWSHQAAAVPEPGSAVILLTSILLLMCLSRHTIFDITRGHVA